MLKMQSDEAGRGRRMMAITLTLTMLTLCHRFHGVRSIDGIYIP